MTRKIFNSVSFFFILCIYSCANGSTQTLIEKTNPSNLLAIAHRGASGHRPEETLPAFELAIDLGSDYIEFDLVSTKDGVLIARHENEISKTTDVEKKFPEKKRTKVIDGENITGWFSEDFTIKEIKSLRAKERLAGRDHSYDGQFQVATLEDILTLVQKKTKELKRTIGIYPEVKHPSYFSTIGLPLEEKLLVTLKAFGYAKKEDALFIQSFEPSSLKKLRTLAPFKLIQLVGTNVYLKKDNLREIRTYAEGIGPHKLTLLKDPSIVSLAHELGLLVHAYTFRNDPPFLDSKYQGDPLKEYYEYFNLGVDGVFSDFPETAIKARRNSSF